MARCHAFESTAAVRGGVWTQMADVMRRATGNECNMDLLAWYAPRPPCAIRMTLTPVGGLTLSPDDPYIVLLLA
jgi:hypothetical protein